MKKSMRKQMVMGLIACGMLTLTASAQNMRYHGDGDWMNASNWTNVDTQTSGTLPGSNFQARVNWDNTVTLSNVAPVVKNLQIGVDVDGTLNIEDGGVISSVEWSSVGNNGGASGIMNVYSNGLADFPSHLWVGFQTPSTGYLNIYNGGEVKIAGMLGAGWNGGTGYITVNSGAVLDLKQLHAEGDSFKNGSTLNITGSGVVRLPISYTNIVDSYVANGHILGNGIVSNTVIEEEYVGATTNLLIKALVAVPNVIGMTLEDATLAIEDLEFTVADPVQTGYVFGAESGSVIWQNPAGGDDAAEESAIELRIQEALASTQLTVDWVPHNSTPTDWMNENNWKYQADNIVGVIPYKETQNFKVRTYSSTSIVLTNQVAVNWLVLGDGGNTNGNVLALEEGAYLSAGWSQWTSIGYSRSQTVTVNTNAVFENKKNVLFAWDGKGGINNANDNAQGGISYLNIDGGTFISKDWFGMGNNSSEAREFPELVYGIVTVDGEGVFDVNRFVWGNTNCVLRMNNGTLVMNQNKTNDVNTWISDGRIEIAPGTTVSLDYDATTTGRTTLRVVIPGFESWAKGWGEDIGAQNHDHDNDGADNLWEYALNGDPTDDQDRGVEPVFSNIGGTLEYVHLSRSDDANLVYTIQTRESLTVGDWLDTGSTVSGSGAVAEYYDSVTNTVDTTTPNTFIRLKIDNP